MSIPDNEQKEAEAGGAKEKSHRVARIGSYDRKELLTKETHTVVGIVGIGVSSRRITMAGSIGRYTCVVRKGRMWLFTIRVVLLANGLSH